jgi:putative transcriptional regulator
MSSHRAHLLIASPRLQDPNFVKAVVLLIQHDKSGAMGLILNRPLPTSVREAVAPLLGDAFGMELPLHLGGPCEGPLMVLHGRSEAAAELIPGVSFTTDREEIEQLMEVPGPPLKFFAGYSGWTSEQLEAEIEEGAWLLRPANASHVYEVRSDLWSRLMTELTAGLDPRQIPDDPSVN